MQPPLLTLQHSSFLATPRHHPSHPTLQLSSLLHNPLPPLQPPSSYSTSASSSSSEPFFCIHPVQHITLFNFLLFPFLLCNLCVFFNLFTLCILFCNLFLLCILLL